MTTSEQTESRRGSQGLAVRAAGVVRPTLRIPLLAICGCAFLLASAAANAEDEAGAGWTWSSGSLELRGGIDAFAYYYSMQGTWWNLAATTDPQFDTRRQFGEFWIHPKLNGSVALGGGHEAYGALSAGLSQTLDADPFDNQNEGTIRFENASLGLRGSTEAGWRYDLSLGRQPFTLGTGMLLTAGSSNGGSWGDAASAPRKSWGRSLIARLGHSDLTGQVFMLEPSELPESRTDTRVQGASIEWARDDTGKVGLAWFTVPKSNAVYPGSLAPLAYIENGRDGLDTWHGWAEVGGLIPGVPTLRLRAELALQRNDITRADGSTDPMKAEAWLLGASYWAQTLPLAPRFTFHEARMSGDRPDTPTYERFDPMFWGNGLDNWWFGANGAYAWINANLRARRVIVDLYPSEKDAVQFQFVRAYADQLNSPVQFGQGATFTDGALVVGVPTAHLSDEYYLQYARVFTPSLIGIAFVSHSVPGSGLKAAATQDLKAWNTFGIGLTASF